MKTLTGGLKKATGVASPSQRTRIYTKRGSDSTKTILLQQFGSRFFTSEVTDKASGAATFITISQLPGSASRFTG